jgi:hypothetical protein
MPETLLTPSNILLYGRVVLDLTINQGPSGNPTHPQGLGSNEFLRQQLNTQAGGRPAPVLARIYAFSYEGHNYDLPRPTIFLVHGPGAPAEPNKPGGAGGSRGPAGADQTGVASQDYSFAEDMQVWFYDKGDFSIRLDVETGPFDQILLEAALGGAGGTYAGANARIAGPNVGANARIAGANVGANVGANAGVRGGGGWSD